MKNYIIFILMSCSSPDAKLEDIKDSSETYTLKVEAGPGGSVSSEGGIYDSGTEITIDAISNQDFEFVNWSNGSTDSSLVFIITEDTNLIANFKLIGLNFSRNSFNIVNPNGRKVDLLTTLNSNPGIFVYQKNGFRYLIVPGVSDAQQTIRDSSPRGKTFVFYKDAAGWSDYTIENDQASTWVVRNFDYNSDFFVLGDANEIGSDWRNWKGDVVKGTPYNGKIEWERVTNPSQMGFFHDVSIGNLNSDNIPDILGVGFKFFLGNQNGYDFVGDDTNFNNPLIDYNFNRPFAIELYDFDGDGIDEIISSDYHETYGASESNRVTIHKYNSTETIFKQIFTSNTPTSLHSEDMAATSIQIFDFNNDGKKDISIARESNSGESFEIWINNGNLTFSPHFSKKFQCNQFNMLEFEVFDANADGNLDIILRPETCGGQPTASFLYSSYPESGKGLRLNDCIWLNDGSGNFRVYDDEELISPLWVDYLFPYLQNGVLHFVGFEYDPDSYNNQNNSMNIDVIDFEVDLR